MEIYDGIHHTREIGEIAKALAAAQGEMKNAPMDKINPHFESKFASLAAIRDAVIPALSKHGIAAVQMTEYEGNRLILRTMLVHSSGQFLGCTYPLPIDKPQVMGSAITYAKRYCLAAMCGISADDDDDANAANAGHKPNKPSATNPKPASAPLSGPLTKTAAQKALSAFHGLMLDDGETPDEVALDAHINDDDAMLAQIEADWPEWLHGIPGNLDYVGTWERIQRRRDELRQRPDPANLLAAG